jgi:hypothetical protein
LTGDESVGEGKKNDALELPFRGAAGHR